MSIWQGFGYNMLVFSAGLRSIPRPLYGAAAIGGAKPWTRFWKIKLPLLTPSIFFGMVMAFITPFQVFVQPYVLTAGGPGVRTTTVVYYLLLPLQQRVSVLQDGLRLRRRLGSVCRQHGCHGAAVWTPKAIRAL
jgi:ABC-type sugar transport system permease subunit